MDRSTLTIRRTEFTVLAVFRIECITSFDSIQTSKGESATLCVKCFRKNVLAVAISIISQ